MAKCEYCNKDMLECDGCDTNQLILNDSNVYACSIQHNHYYTKIHPYLFSN